MYDEREKALELADVALLCEGALLLRRRALRAHQFTS